MEGIPASVIKEAAHCSELSEIVYKQDCRECIEGLCANYQKTEYFDVSGAQAAATIKDGKGYIIFRGTEISDLNDIVADVKIWKVCKTKRGGCVHDGFYYEVNKVDELIKKWIDSNKSLIPNGLYITGHSLGAAMATVFTSRLDPKEYDIKKVFTYGSPRVGNWKFKNRFDTDYDAYRFVNKNDVVTRMPTIGYSHVGKLCYINTNNEIITNPSMFTMAYGAIIGRIQGVLRLKIFSALTDHSMTNYVDVLKNHCEKCSVVTKKFINKCISNTQEDDDIEEEEEQQQENRVA